MNNILNTTTALRLLASSAGGVAILGFLYGMGLETYGIPVSNPSIANYVPIDTPALIAIALLMAALAMAFVPRVGCPQLSVGLSTSAAASYALGVSWQMAQPQTAGATAVFAAMLAVTIALSGVEFRKGFLSIRKERKQMARVNSDRAAADKKVPPADLPLRLAQLARSIAPAAGAWVASSSSTSTQLLIEVIIFAGMGGLLGGAAGARLGAAAALLAGSSHETD